jgi:ADP-heptose:LPS heptosyltransferase
VKTFDRKRGFNAAIALLREPGIVGVLVDQHAGDGGMWTPFFGRLASTSTLAATLAMRTNAVVIPVAIYTSGFAKWRVVLREEVPWQAGKAEELTADINTALEQQIRESPADWFWVHNRWKMPWPNFLCASVKRGVFVPPGAPLRPFRVVVRSPNWLGDAVMSAGAALAFKTGRPDAMLAILCPAKLADFWRQISGVDEVIEIEKGESVFSVAGKLRGRFDAAVLFPNSLRCALEAWLAGIPRRVGYRGHNRAFFLNQIIAESHEKARRPDHHADRYWRIAHRCGALEVPHAPAPWSRPEGIPVIGICAGAEFGPAKRWPVERFREVVSAVNDRLTCEWVLVGTTADSALASGIADGFSNVRDLTGKTSLGELIGVVRNFHALLTNDTGTMHLADFLGVPLVAVFGSTEPALTGPRGLRSRVIRQQVECSPCFLRECPIDFRCMREISTDAVVAAVLQAVDRGD